MHRVSEDILSTHMEMAIATASPSLFERLASDDRLQRHAAVGEIACHLVERLRCFEFLSEEASARTEAQRCLFPGDLRPIG